MPNNTYNMPNRMITEGFAQGYAAGTFIPEHCHETHQIVHAISGAMRVNADAATWIVPPGRALWVSANTPHSIACKGEVAMRTVYLKADLPTVRARVAVLNVSPLMREVLVRLSEGGTGAQVAPLVAILLMEINMVAEQCLRLPTPQDPRIAGLVAELLARPADPKPLKDWARHLGFSERNLIRVIHAQTGLSFRELRRQIRIVRAIEVLSAGHSVTNAALDVGYETTSAFIHAFRQITGGTPGKYIS